MGFCGGIVFGLFIVMNVVKLIVVVVWIVLLLILVFGEIVDNEELFDFVVILEVISEEILIW